MGYIQDKMTIKRLLKKAFLQIDYTGNIDQKIESILVKLANEITFEEAIKGKKFVNPKTKNKVNFSSLPGEEQKKIRGQFEKKVQEGGAKQQGGGEKKGPAVKGEPVKLTKKQEELVKKYRKPKKELSPAEKKEIQKKVDQSMKEMNDKFEKDSTHRAKVVDNVVKSVGSPEAKEGIVAGIKEFVNADDFKSFGNAIMNKDPAGMKKALPGMMKGMLKGVLAVVGTALAVGAIGMAAQNATSSVMDDMKDDMKEDIKNDLEISLSDFEESMPDALAEQIQETEFLKALGGEKPSEPLQFMFDDMKENGLGVLAEAMASDDVEKGEAAQKILDGIQKEIQAAEDAENAEMNRDSYDKRVEIRDKLDKLMNINSTDILLAEDLSDIVEEERKPVKEALRTIETKVREYEDTLDNINDQYSDIEDENANLKDEIADKEKQKEEQLEKVNKALDEKREIEKQMKAADVDLSEYDENRKQVEKLSEKSESFKKLINVTLADIEDAKVKIQHLDATSPEFLEAVKKLERGESYVSFLEKGQKDNQESLNYYESKSDELMKDAMEAAKLKPELQKEFEEKNRVYEEEFYKNKDIREELSQMKTERNLNEEKLKSLQFAREETEKPLKEITSQRDNMDKLNSDLIGVTSDERDKVDDPYIDSVIKSETAEEKYFEKQIRKANMKKFSKEDVKDMGIIAEKLQKAFCAEMEKLKKDGKSEKGGKSEKPKTNKKASRNRDTDFDIKFI
jgi:hypothetical protein